MEEPSRMEQCECGFTKSTIVHLLPLHIAILRAAVPLTSTRLTISTWTYALKRPRLVLCLFGRLGFEVAYGRPTLNFTDTDVYP